jgi:hypothetical protein
MPESDFSPVVGCESCDKNIAERAGLTTVYGYQFRDDPEKLTGRNEFGISLHVRAAQSIVNAHMHRWLIEHGEPPAGFKRLDCDQIEIWLPHALDLNEDHALNHIPASAAWRPGIMLDFTIECVPDAFRAILAPMMVQPVTSILMDGNHRALRALRTGRPYFPILVLTPEEVQRIFAGIELGALMRL